MGRKIWESTAKVECSINITLCRPQSVKRSKILPKYTKVQFIKTVNLIPGIAHSIKWFTQERKLLF